MPEPGLLLHCCVRRYKC